MSPNFHNFDDTGDAYNQTQYRDDIKDGDVLFVSPAKVYGFLFQAWPIAVTVEHGEFHHPAKARGEDRPCTRAEWLAADPEHAKYAESWDIAASWAIAEGAEILPL